MTELTNLLPPARLRALRQLYFIRLAVVGILLLSALILIHGVLMLPSYLYLKDQVGERTNTLKIVTQTLAGTEEQEVNARVLALAADSTYLAELSKSPKATATISAVLKLARPGVRLYGFSFAPGKGEATMNISGIASTREALRSFERSLANEPYVTSTNLPISAYAKERDIDFTIALTGPFLP